jgi:hypothetical protein
MRTVPDIYVRWFLVIVYVCLFVFASIAWFERMNSDAGYYLFHSINKKFFYVEHGRLVLAIAEVTPLFFTWLGLPLKWVVWVYSTGHVLFFSTSAFYSRRISGNWNIPLAISLCAFMGLRESVFTPQFELYYGLVFLLLATAIYQRYRQAWNPGSLIMLLVVLVFAITSHPMALLCCFWLFALLSAERRAFNIREFAVLAGLAVLYFVWKKATASGYESGKFDLYWNAIKEGKFLEVFSNGNFVKQLFVLLRYYPDVLLLFLFGIFHLLRSRKALSAATYTAFVLFFLFLVWMLYPDSTQVFRYLEQVYFPFVFAAICFVLLRNQVSYVLLGIAVLTLLFRGVTIGKSYRKFEARTALMDRFIDHAANSKGQRFYVGVDDMGAEQFDLADWSYGFESMVRSRICVGKTISIVTQEDLDFENNANLLRDDEYLFRRWEREKTSTLNQEYFKMDSGKYRYLLPEKLPASFKLYINGLERTGIKSIEK